MIDELFTTLKNSPGCPLIVKVKGCVVVVATYDPPEVLLISLISLVTMEA